ncbi:uncharacterized protein LOC122086418 isoform X2 [Macadamia integrifolia]|uniref:uncharacterized protein LOC122086418 isoform X2 n=1 Tax=Macadamia integrifolia TaxID=60698 RepID=UPI001C4F282B|nr:uncharacterized protein LOC122086418 isoform X2 [Macadamia integrifolia]
MGLDGCHLKGRYGGVLLSAIAVDGNNGIYPIAFSIVEVENKDSWTFFLHCLDAALRLDDCDIGLTFGSDKQKGLADAISGIFPGAHHRNCCRNLYSKFKASFPGLLLKTQFWVACKASKEFIFNKTMEIKGLNKAAYDWLLNSNHPSMWSRHAFDKRAKSDHVTNNMTESFNNWIRELRSKPILTLVDELRCKLMRRLDKRYKKAATMEGRVTPNIRKKLDMIIDESGFCNAIPLGTEEFEVIDGRSRMVVHLMNKTCCCKEWDGTGIPCRHAASAIKFIRDLKNVDYLSDANEVWQHPPLKRLPGRPKKNRKREPGEDAPRDLRKKSYMVQCEIYKRKWHNKRTCERDVDQQEKQQSRPRGGLKRKNSDVDLGGDSSLEMVTRSQATTTGSQSSVKERQRERMTKKATLMAAKRASKKGDSGRKN